MVSNIESVPGETLYRTLHLKTGDRYDVRRIEESLLDITNKLGDLGYAFVNVVPNIKTNPKKQLLI
ncbi:MAG: hypothetical protein CM15mP117_21530 [Alphaproteobacteria bacterium]|nr:MAG: hypothetical protein CM15mP117_21530 [Alphaproteobacteria bacterium]